MRRHWVTSCCCVVLLAGVPRAVNAEETNFTTGLVAHWPLTENAQDASGHGHHARNQGVRWNVLPQNAKKSDAVTASRFQNQPSALFDGRGAYLEVPHQSELQLGRGDFTAAAWIYTEPALDDLPGDILSQEDATRHRGFRLTLKSNSGVTFNQANARQLQFGIDDQRVSPWKDCGRPGKNTIVAFALAVHHGQLYAGTCEPGTGESGRVYRYAGNQEWTDCGAPASSNAITAMAAHDGQLFVGTGKYRLAGSSLTESENTNLGGRVFRYGGGTKWIDCGQLPNAEAVSGLVEFRGRLYSGSLYRPAGFFRYEGDTSWTDCGVPNGKRVEALGVFNSHLYATSYDEGHVYRFDGQTWTDCGQLGDPTENTQTYSFAVYEGRLYVGTWRSGRVYRFEDLGKWTDVGRLGEELEVMGMLVHNGRLIAGTLPLAEVYSYEGSDRWERLARLDHTPDVKYRRAWSMAEYQGQVFCSTLPSGRVFACEIGKSVTWDRELSAGWHHVAGIKSEAELRLYVDGELQAHSSAFNRADFDLSNGRPLRIGTGSNDFFNGRLRDVRLYRRALNAGEVLELAKPKS